MEARFTLAIKWPCVTKNSRLTLKIASIGGLALMALALAGLFMRGSLFSLEPVVIGAQCAAAALMIWARVVFGRRSFHAVANPTAGGLVTTGPYSFIRHPIYAATCLFGCAGVASHWSATSVQLGVLLLVGALVRMLCEERLVAVLYPEYRDYARVTKRIVPYFF
jgi:protein-S-isoprenylcysteine O-methyltransferase Ste14